MQTPAFFHAMEQAGRKTIRKVLLATSITLFASTPTFAALDMFLDIPGVPGESLDETYVNTIDVLAWSWGSVSDTSKPAGRRGLTCLQNLNVTKWMDLASARLLMGQMMGTVYPEITLIVRRAGDTPVETLNLILTNVRVVSLSTGGAGGEDRLAENVSFSYDTLSFQYTEFSSGPGPGGDSNSTTVEVPRRNRCPQ